MSQLLKHKTFISTRPQGQNTELKKLLEEQGAQLLEMPTIEIKPASLSLDEEDMLDHISQFSWIVFTSPNGIRYFFKKLNEITGSFDLPSSVKTAVVGSKSSRVLAEYGHETTLENPGTTGEDLAEELVKAINTDDMILFPEGDIAKRTISNRLSAIAECVHLTVYKNTMPPAINQQYLDLIIKNQYTSIVLTSPSGFINLVSLLKDKLTLTDLRLICIGSTTANEVSDRGLTPKAVATMTNAQGVFNAILESTVNE